MAKGKGFEMVMKLKAQLDKAVPTTMQKLSKEMGSLKDKQKQLNSINKLVPKHLHKNMLEYKKISSKLQMLNKLKDTNGSLSKEQEKEYKTLIKAQSKLGKTVDKERSAYARYSLELKKLKIPHGQLQNEIRKTGKELEEVTKKQKLFNRVASFKKKVGAVGKKALVAGGKFAAGAAVAGVLATGAFAGQSASQYADFEGQMKRVQAISGASKKDYATLEKAALKFGATTSFTSTQAAAGMEKFALAGFKTKDIISAMPGMLDLAAASGEDLALVSDIISDNMTAFGLKAEDTGKVADIFAYTMSKTNTDVGTLGEAFKYISAQSKGMNVSIEESSSLLGLLADKGIKGSSAGTGLGAVYSQISKNASEFQNLGLKLTDKSGDFIGTANFLGQLEGYFKKNNINGLKKQEMLTKMFRVQGAKVVNALLDGEKEINGVLYTGVARIKAQTKATNIEAVGSAGKMRDIMLEGINGTRTLFLSAVDGLKMAVGKSIFTEKTLKSIKTATKYISEFGLVLRGELSDNPINKFWQNVFEKINKLKKTFVDVLGPGFKALKNILTDPSMINFFKLLGKTLLSTMYIVAYAFTKIAQGLELINRYIGIDNIIMFIGAFAGIGKIVTGISFLIGKLVLLKASIASAGGVITYLKSGLLATKTSLLTLGGPIVWVGAAILGLLYLFHKFGGIKNNLLGIWEVIKQWFVTLGSIISTLNAIYNPFKVIYDLGMSFWNNWDSSKGILDNLKSGFFGFFDGIKERIKAVGNNFLALGDKVKNIPIIGALLNKLGVGSEVKADGSHRTGLDYVPYDGYMAELHKGERVLTAEENNSFGGKMLSKLKSNSSSETNTNSYTNNNKETSFSIGDINITIEKIETSNADETLKALADMSEKLRKKILEDIKRMVKDGARTTY